MKKYIIILFISLLTSCAGVKKTKESSSITTIKENRELVKDSTKNTQINKGIDDAVKIFVTGSQTDNKDFDRAVDKAVDEILSKMNISKKSGDNSYELYYDLIKRELQLRTTVAETKNETLKTNSKEVTQTSVEENVKQYSKTVISLIPWWGYAIGIFLILPRIIQTITLIVNPIRGLLQKPKA